MYPTRAFAFILATWAAGSGPLGADDIRGTVRNDRTGAYLAGAEISLVEHPAVAVVSERDGSFLLKPVPPGTHRIRVFYTGLDAVERVVTVGTAAAAVVDVALASEVYRLEQFVVAGEREGNAAALMSQRAAPNVVNVVSMDAYGNVADGNIGNFLQNLPGIAANKEGGDIVGVGLRGTPPELNAVTVDGTRSAYPVIGYAPQGDRAMAIDQIPSEAIKEIEVTKGNRPENPADSLGGSVNLVTKSAFDYRSRVVTYRAGANQNTYRSGMRITPTLAATFMDTFLARRLGVAFSASYTETTNTRDRVQMSHLDPDVRNSRARLLDDTTERIRAGAGGNFEWRFDASARVWLNLNVNYYASELSRHNRQASAGGGRRIADYARVSRAAIEAGTQPRDSANATAGIAPGFTATFTELLGATWTNQAARETRRQRQFKAAVGAEKKWGDTRLTFVASHNPTSAANNFFGFTTTRTGVGMAIDQSRETTRPIFRQTYGPTVGFGSDFSGYLAQRFEQPDRTTEEIDNVRVDLDRTLRIAGVPVRLKAGLDHRLQERWFLNTYRPIWLYGGADRLQGLNAATRVNDDNLAQFVTGRPGAGLFNGYYPQFDVIDLGRTEAMFRDHPEYFVPSGTTVAFSPVPGIGRERVLAGYGQGTATLGPVQVLAGARLEETRLDTRGSLADARNPGRTSIQRSGDYRKAFPSLHLRYTPGRAFVVRGSYSTGSARPGLADLVPNTTVSYNATTGLGTVTSANPGLKPQYSENYDVAIEAYFEPAGVLSAGVFRKEITDFIAPIQTVIADGTGNGFGGDYAEFLLNTKTNLGQARVDGLELNYSQRLRFLPRPLETLSLFANYTRLNTSGAYATGSSPLAGFVPTTYNLGLTYDWRQWQLRVRYNYKSDYLYTAGAANAGSRVTDDPTVDLNLQYRFRPWLTVYVDYINVFNNSPDWYMRDRRLIEMSELYGARLNVGVSGRF
ncbi:MAG: TonB-dependent receptor [Verrucomicrobia bacterium]|nr:TonB-dependent receptor [Verrucomicrobiota bacterium]